MGSNERRKGSELDALDDVIRGLKLFLHECAAREYRQRMLSEGSEP